MMKQNRSWLLAVGILLIVVGVLVGGCTENDRAARFGGTMKIKLPENQKLVTVTWKMDKDSPAQLWYLTRPMRAGEVAETYTFKEKASLGVLEGKVILEERKGN